MGSPAETVQSIQKALEPFVRPREEATHIRRVLKAHLAACLKSDDALEGSLALVDISWDVSVSPEARGLQRAYLRALQANLEARRAFEQRRRETTNTVLEKPAPGFPFDQMKASSPSSILEDYLLTIRLARKKERLQVLHRYLDALGDKPVAAGAGEDFLRPAAIYGEATRTLPSVPKAVLDGLAEDMAESSAAAADASATAAAASTTADLESLVAHLEKSVLRAQLVLRQEEKRLATAKARASRLSQSSKSDAEPAAAAAAKLQALGAARNELIAWMEAELGNAASEDKEEDEEGESAAESSKLLRQSLLEGHEDGASRQKKARIEEKLAEIRRKYQQYVDARRALVQTVGSMTSGVRSHPAMAPPLFANMPHLPPQQQTEGVERSAPAEKTGEEASSAAESNNDDQAAKIAALGNLLMAPYLERLLAVARDQKADIAHKAHHNVVLAKRLKDTCQVLDHLAEESQLLPQHPMPGGASRGAGGARAALLRKKNVLAGPATGRDGSDGASQRVAAWTYAADSAKIATFEAVAEQVEAGQVALEQATKALAEVDVLLGRQRDDEEENADEGESARGKQHAVGRKRANTAKGGGDIWATLNGELGLLRAQDDHKT